MFQLPPYIFGLHDLGGENLMLDAGKPGWVLHTAQAGDQPPDFSSFAERGLGVIVRLNHGYGSTGTIPPSSQYDAFAQACANYVRNSQDAHVWLIGNEMNISAERPQLPDGSFEVITPALYAKCFLKCRAAIKSLPGHGDDWVVPGAVGPYNPETGEWVQYLVDTLKLLGNQLDAIALHTYTHDFIADQISNDQMMDPPYQNRHFNFRAYRDFLNALPAPFQSLPVLITETNPFAGWRDANTGWIQAAYAEINNWNSNPAHQPIQALVLFRWNTLEDHREWGIQDKNGARQDFRGALQNAYTVRMPLPHAAPAQPQPAPGPAPSQPAQPAVSAAGTYTVQSGDTLSKIARQFASTVAAIAAANNIANPGLIRVGQVLIIPQAASVAPAMPSFGAGDLSPSTGEAGWCPFAVKRPISADNFSVGRQGQSVKAVVLHVVAGHMANVFNVFNGQARPVSAHFCVGKDGRIEQYVSIDDTAYGNGLAWVDSHWAKNRGTQQDPKWIPVVPTWQDLIPGVNPNAYTISIEHDGDYQDEWTPEMYEANNRLLQWLAQQTDLTYVPHRTLIGHCEIDTVDKVNCPGPHVNYEQIAADANAVIPSPEKDAAVQAARNLPQLPININSALYKFAMVNNLGCPQTDEFEFPVDGVGHVGQVYNGGIVYVKKDDWGNIAWIAKTSASTADKDANVARVAAAQLLWMPVNVDSALYKFAQAHSLGFPQTDEFEFSVSDVAYIGQTFAGALLYAPKTNIADIRVVAKTRSVGVSFGLPMVAEESPVETSKPPRRKPAAKTPHKKSVPDKKAKVKKSARAMKKMATKTGKTRGRKSK